MISQSEKDACLEFAFRHYKDVECYIFAHQNEHDDTTIEQETSEQDEK